MSKNIQITIVGAGSSYTPELLNGITRRSHEELPVGRIHLTDLNPDRLQIMADLSRRMVAHKERSVAIKHDTNLEKMLKGADFVVTQIRVGGMDSRYLDESIPLKYGVLGQETTGAGGMFKALRTIPRMLEIGHAVERICPEAFILNYTNPSGIVTEAMLKHTQTRFLGLCSGIPGMQRTIKEEFKDRYPDLHSRCVGLNHLGFIHYFESGGKDVSDQVIGRYIQTRMDKLEGKEIPDVLRIIELLRAIPIGYVEYFFNRAKRIKELQEAPEMRSQTIMKIEKSVFAEAASPECVTRPEALNQRGGGGYSGVTFSFLAAILNDTGEELTCSARNDQCVEDIEADAAVELVCKIGANGAEALPVGKIPLAFRGVIQAVKAYETLTVQAAVERSKTLAVQALLNNPLVGDLDVAEPLVNELLKAHQLDFQ